MKANLPRTEPEMLAWWDAMGLYKRLREAAAGRPAMDPPRRPPVRQRRHPHGAPAQQGAQGHHRPVAHDARIRRRLRPRLGLPRPADRAPGRQGAGLDSASVDVRRAMDPVEKRQRCREYALRFIDLQRDEFRRLGVIGDWENPYLTMTPAYEAVIARELGRFVGPRPRLPGAQADPLVHVLQDGARRRPSSNTRTSAPRRST